MGAETESDKLRGTIRRFRPEDAAEVAAMLRDSPQAANWTEASYRESAERDGALALVSEAEGCVVGFIIGRQVADEAEILNLAARPANRRRGEGEALLKALLEELGSRQVSRVLLEVRESNENGITFYLKHGFSKTGRRPRYYREPEEAAILMELKLTG